MNRRPVLHLKINFEDEVDAGYAVWKKDEASIVSIRVDELRIRLEHMREEPLHAVLEAEVLARDFLVDPLIEIRYTMRLKYFV